MKLPKELQKKKKKNIIKPKIPLKKRIEWSKQISKMNEKCRFKGCLFPDKSSCSSQKPVKAHSIQKSTILKSISDSGKVLSFDVRNSFFNRDFEEFGVGEASTFFGFCGYHDSVVFSDIENKTYSNEKKQNFLFAYRACAFEYAECKYAECHSKEMKKLTNKDYAKEFYESKNLKDITDLKDIEIQLDKFSTELKKPENKRNYDVIFSRHYELNKKVLIAVNSVFSLYYDFNGNPIYDPYDYSIELPSLFLNVFPQEDKTHIILSCFSKDKKKYDTVFNTLDSLTDLRIEEVISQIIVVHCGNLFISPSKWLRISNAKRKVFVSRFINTMGPIPEKSYLTNKSPLNIFTVLN